MKKIPMLEKFAAQSLVESEGELIFSKEKFAELIVKECADIAKHHVMNISTYADAEFVEEQIKKDFGIKEQTGWVCNECGVDRTKEECPKGHIAAITGECPMTAEAQ